MPYISRDEAYRFVSKMREIGAIGYKDHWEYVAPPRQDVVTAINISREVAGKEYELSVNTFGANIIGELYAAPKRIHNAFKAMEQMPYSLLHYAELAYVSTPSGGVVETNIFSKQITESEETECIDYPTIRLIYSFMNGSVTTRRWEFPFNLMPYFDIDDFKRFTDSILALEVLYSRFEGDKEVWMKGWSKAQTYL